MNAPGNSSGLVTRCVVSSRSIVWPASRSAVSSSGVADKPPKASTAIRLARGRISRTNCNLFPARSVDKSVMPVTLPPGCPRLATRPLPTGSATAAITMGIVLVARFAALTAGVAEVTISSTLSATSSVARAASRSSFSAAQR